MTHIYQSDYEQVQEKKVLNKLLLELPAEIQERANRYKFKKDAYNFVTGRLLLKKGLEDLGEGEQLKQIKYRKDGKPFLKNIFFNISHTENLIACAFSTKGEIGIDIENIKQVKIDDFRPWFSNTEWTDINKANSPISKFYWYWCRKESIIKALGVSLSYLQQIELDATKDHFLDKGKKWYIKDLDIGSDYVGALCSEYPINKLKLIK